ncbi:infB [Symbiodinium natans]|uniref:InfB protein n=1 Tax=Symbiodinium natans TaxID=878477 RepID=A0A812I3I6_9DINO|nr:infB [Symbiodinium natans]
MQRQWSRVAEAAEAENPDTVPASRRSELDTLNRIRHRDGHVCGSLEEYLHAAADDLVAWERSLAGDAPQAAKRKLEGAWRHWHEILFEYGHIFGAVLAERLRERVRLRRSQLRDERCRQRGQDLRLPAGKVWFEATTQWQEVPSNAICAAGLEYRCDMQTGRNFARLAM